jgi:hypothetical protein
MAGGASPPSPTQSEPNPMASAAMSAMATARVFREFLLEEACDFLAFFLFLANFAHLSR